MYKALYSTNHIKDQPTLYGVKVLGGMKNVNGKVKSNYRAHERLVLLLGEILLCEQVMEHLEWVPYWVWQRSPPFGADPPFGTDICYVWGVCVRPDPSPPNNDCQQSQWSSMTRILYVLCRDMTIRSISECRRNHITRRLSSLQWRSIELVRTVRPPRPWVDGFRMGVVKHLDLVTNFVIGLTLRSSRHHTVSEVGLTRPNRSKPVSELETLHGIVIVCTISGVWRHIMWLSSLQWVQSNFVQFPWYRAELIFRMGVSNSQWTNVTSSTL